MNSTRNVNGIRLCVSIFAIMISDPLMHAQMVPGAPGPSNQVLLGFSAGTGELWFDDWACGSETASHTSPRSDKFDVASVISEAGIFLHPENAVNLGGIFDRSTPTKLFKINPGGFGEATGFGRVADPGLSEEFLLADLSFDAGGRECRDAGTGLTYFPQPNLSTDGQRNDEQLSIIYKAVDGGIGIDIPIGTNLPWIGFYSASDIFEDASHQRDIDSRIQYRFDVTSSTEFGSISRSRLDVEALRMDLSVVASDVANQPSVREFDLIYIPVGDVNEDTLLNTADIDLITSAVRAESGPQDYDLNSDGTIDHGDRVFWVENSANTFFGDSNLDGEFNSGDFTTVFNAGEYRDDVPGNSSWGTGDWNGDGDFTHSDFVTAFIAGGYLAGPRTAPTAVPEPSLVEFIVFGSIVFVFRSRRARRCRDARNNRAETRL